jgi:hypothetical protein
MTHHLFDNLKRDLLADPLTKASELNDDGGFSGAAALTLDVDGVPVMLVPGDEDAMLCADCGEIPKARERELMHAALDLSLALYRELGATLCTNPITGHLLTLERVPLEAATARDVLERARRLASVARRYAKDGFGAEAEAEEDDSGSEGRELPLQTLP